MNKKLNVGTSWCDLCECNEKGTSYFMSDAWVGWKHLSPEVRARMREME